MFNKTCLLGLLLSILVYQATAQSKDHHVFALSNLHEVGPTHPLLDSLEILINRQSGTKIIVLNGDWVDDNGLGKNPSDGDIAKVDRILAMADDDTHLILVPGDREWDNGSNDGLKKVKALEKFIKKRDTKNVHFITEDGCPGPDVLDIGPNLRFIGMNSQWYNQQDNKRPEEEDVACDFYSLRHSWNELEDEIQESENRNIVILSHHPVYSRGQYAGYKLGKKWWMPPLIGPFIAAYHQNVGAPTDLARPGLQYYAGNLKGMMERNPGLIFLSGHERDLQIHQLEGNYHINSGAPLEGKPVGKSIHTVYRQSAPGLIQLRFAADGSVDAQIFKQQDYHFGSHKEIALLAAPCGEKKDADVPYNSNYIPCLEKIGVRPAGERYTQPESGSAVAGAEYKAGPIHRLILGKHYRETWATEINNIPYLSLDSLHGGLTPYTMGGSAQTKSLKFKGGNGQKYAFRSVNKTPTQKKNQELVDGIFGDIVQDLTSSQLPYAPLIISRMMKEIGVADPDPKLYLMPDDPKLGPFREDFAGMLGYLELRPKPKKKDREGYKDADRVDNTFEMYQKLIEDRDDKIDQESFLKARLMDNIVVDWDRHMSNWSWLGYGDKKAMTYYPYAKDRDKAMSRMGGMFRLLDMEMISKDMARFRKRSWGLKSLNYKNRTMDHFLLAEATLDDWLAAARSIQEVLTDAVIDSAIHQMPAEVVPISGDWVAERLRYRRDDLENTARKYYKMISKHAIVVGTEDEDHFAVSRLTNGHVRVVRSKLKKNGTAGKKLFDRTYLPAETKEIRFYGLGEEDHFVLDGEGSPKIKLRIVSGKGDDLISDLSSGRKASRGVKIYDAREQDSLAVGNGAKLRQRPEPITFESENLYSYDYTYVFPSFSYNVDDGFGLGFRIQVDKAGFHKPGFGRQYVINMSATTNGNYNLGLSHRLRYAFGKWDAMIGFSMANPDRSFRNFYGFGNESVLDRDLRSQRYYENKMSSWRVNLGIERNFLKQSRLTIELAAEARDLDPVNSPSDGPGSIYETFDFTSNTTLIGPRIDFDLDFRDSRTFPRRGTQFQLNNYSFASSDANWNIGGLLQTEVNYFVSAGIRNPVTLSVRGGIHQAYGSVPFYYKAFLGQQTNLRGYLRNRFGGDRAVFLNTDLRLHLGTIRNPVLPVYAGIYGLFDVGRVYDDLLPSEDWHPVVGGGFYFVPYAESFNLTFTLAKALDDDLLFSFRVGFFVR